MFEPIMQTIIEDEDTDGHTTMSVYKERPLKVIQEELQLTANNRYCKDHPDGKYVGSGLWQKYRSDVDGSLRISVDVGCWCAYDCCNHLCHLSYHIHRIGGLTIVMTFRGYNR